MNFKDLWSDLPPQVKELFQAKSSLVQIKRGAVVYRQGDSPLGIYFVQSGLVGLTKIGVSGKEHLLRFFRVGQFFGHRALFSSEDYHGSAVALEETTLQLVPKATVLEAIKKHPELLLPVVQVLARELRRCEDLHVLILDNQINIRVAQSLIFLKDLHPDHNWTRQEIANFCASTVSTVIKALAELEELGYIRQVGRTIEILNREKLISLQDEH